MEILNNILIQLKNRFQSMRKLDFFCLLNINMYDRYNKDFHENSLKTLEMQYGKFCFFYINCLRNKLSVLYCSHEPDFEFITFLSGNSLKIGLKYVHKHAKLIAQFLLQQLQLKGHFLLCKEDKNILHVNTRTRKTNFASIVVNRDSFA